MSEHSPSRLEHRLRWQWTALRGRRHRDQGGFVLLLVLGLMVFFAVVSIALLQLTQTTSRVAEKLPNAMRQVREADSALDSAVNQIRSNPSACTSSIAIAGYPAFDLTCAQTPSADPNRRDLLIKIKGSPKPLGQVRVVITDAVPSPVLGEPATPAIGYQLTVCDWQIGDVVSSSSNTCTIVP